MPDRPPRNTKIVAPVLPNRSHVRTPDRLLSRVPGDGGVHGRDRSGCRYHPAGSTVRRRHCVRSTAARARPRGPNSVAPFDCQTGAEVVRGQGIGLDNN